MRGLRMRQIRMREDRMRRKVLSISAGGLRRRSAFALGEALILIIVVLIVFGGIFGSMAMTMRMRAFTQVDLDARLVAQSWFEAMGTTDKSILKSSPVTFFNAVADRLGWVREGAAYRWGGMIVRPSMTAAVNGSYPVKLDVARPKGGKLTFSGGVSAYEERSAGR